MAESADSSILIVARDAEEVVVTHDLDYGELLAFSGAVRPSVVIVRISDVRIQTLARRLLAVLRDNRDVLLSGAVVVIGDHNVRVRRLPIG